MPEPAISDVPLQYRGALRQLKDLPDPSFDVLLQLLSSFRDKQDSKVTLFGRIAQLPEELDAPSLIEALIGLEVTRLGPPLVDRRSAADQVARSLEAGEDQLNGSSLAERIEATLGSAAILHRAKAYLLQLEHDRVYLGARVITQLRPIFDDDATQGPRGAIMTHVLRVDTFARGQRGESFYFGMDDDDLDELKAVVDRAIDKRGSTRAYVPKVGLIDYALGD